MGSFSSARGEDSNVLFPSLEVTFFARWSREQLKTVEEL